KNIDQGRMAIGIILDLAEKERRRLGSRTGDLGESADVKVSVRAFDYFQLAGSPPVFYQSSEVTHDLSPFYLSDVWKWFMPLLAPHARSTEKSRLRFWQFISIEAHKNFPVFFCDSIPFDAVAGTVQSFAGFEVESESVLSATNHFVPNVASF